MKNKLELYLHIPFCVRKCAYCDFLSAPADEDAKRAYARALVREIRSQGEGLSDYEVDTVFIGGGTPTVMPADALTDIMKALTDSFKLQNNAEITIEMNPGTGNAAMREFIYNYVNRVSLGLQSTDPSELSELGRIHTYEDFLNAYTQLREIGISNINVDLMSGIPRQSAENWCHTLHTVCDLKPEHISAYSLIVEEGTPFFERQKKGTLSLPDEDTERRMYYDTRQILSEYGYHRYEISNYALPGYECRHNTGYWTGKNYLGLGLGSSSYLSHIRWKNTSDLARYLKDSGSPKTLPEQVERLSQKSEIEEFMFLGLRMTCGVTFENFRSRFGRDMYELYGEVLERLTDEELLMTDDTGVRLSDRGVDISNQVLAEFLL